MGPAMEACSRIKAVPNSFKSFKNIKIFCRYILHYLKKINWILKFYFMKQWYLDVYPFLDELTL